MLCGSGGRFMSAIVDSGIGVSCPAASVGDRRSVFMRSCCIWEIGCIMSCFVCSCSSFRCLLLFQSICLIMYCTSCGCSILLYMVHVHCCVPALYLMLFWRHVMSSLGTPVFIISVLFFRALAVRRLSSCSRFRSRQW